MKRALCFASAILLLVGCQKDATTNEHIEAGVTTLSISLEESRTSLGSKVDGIYPTFWSEGDCIAINGYKSDAAEINSQDEALATFTVRAMLDYPYFITYPHISSSTADSPKVEFMAVQEYTEGSFANGSAPMCGYVAKSGDRVVLSHLAGVLRFAIRGEEGVQSVLKKLTITSTMALSGDFTVDCQSGTISPTQSSNKSVILNISQGLTLSSDKDSYLYIAVPHGVLGLCELTFTDTKGKELKARWNGTAVKAGVVREFKSIVFRHTNAPVQLDDMYETEGEWGYEEGTTIAGYVKSNGAPLKGVVVSDGLLCTQTNEKGFYSLKSDLSNAKFVMVSIPSGYTAPTDGNGLPIFYHRITESEVVVSTLLRKADHFLTGTDALLLIDLQREGFAVGRLLFLLGRRVFSGGGIGICSLAGGLCRYVAVIVGVCFGGHVHIFHRVLVLVGEIAVKGGHELLKIDFLIAFHSVFSFQFGSGRPYIHGSGWPLITSKCILGSRHCRT
ncbi:MAG: hypothetical protein IIX04_03790 [Alistipes sp.]|nr:hypothetical protein [Alistipes sp.]